MLDRARKAVWLGCILVMLSLGSLLMAACGETATPLATTTSATTAAAAMSAAAMTTMAAATSAAAMISVAATTSAVSTKTAATTTVATTSSSATAEATSATGTATGEVVVYAAASLTEPFNQIKTELEKANPGLKITYSFGGSNTLRTQLEQGAKADVFASANQTEMDNALKASLVNDKGTTFVRNRLVVILPKGNPGKIQKLQDLANPGLKFVTAQKDVPVGGYTLTALDKMSKDAAFGSDFSTKVQANIVSRETDVKQVVAKIQTGEGDVGVVYSSDVTAKVSADITTIEIPDQFNTVANYPIAILKGAGNPAAAKVFVEYVLGANGQAILKKNNFVPVSNLAG